MYPKPPSRECPKTKTLLSRKPREPNFNGRKQPRKRSQSTSPERAQKGRKDWKTKKCENAGKNREAQSRARSSQKKCPARSRLYEQSVGYQTGPSLAIRDWCWNPGVSQQGACLRLSLPGLKLSTPGTWFHVRACTPRNQTHRFALFLCHFAAVNKARYTFSIPFISARVTFHHSSYDLSASSPLQTTYFFQKNP